VYGIYDLSMYFETLRISNHIIQEGKVERDKRGPQEHDLTRYGKRAFTHYDPLQPLLSLIQCSFYLEFFWCNWVWIGRKRKPILSCSPSVWHKDKEVVYGCFPPNRYPKIWELLFWKMFSFHKHVIVLV